MRTTALTYKKRCRRSFDVAVVVFVIAIIAEESRGGGAACLVVLLFAMMAYWDAFTMMRFALVACSTSLASQTGRTTFRVFFF